MQAFSKKQNPTIYIILLPLSCHLLYGQTAPEVHWKRTQWAPREHVINTGTAPTSYPTSGSSQTQNNSGEDWYYSFTKGYSSSNNVHESYICAGFSTYVNHPCESCHPLPDEQDPLSEGDIELLACPNYRNGCRYGNVSKVRLDGSVIWFRTYSDNALEILEVIQSADKEYIYVCGESRSYTVPYNHKTSSGFLNTQQIDYGSTIPCNSSMKYLPKPYVAKIRYSDGELMWERVYGSNNNTGCFFELTGRATDLIQDGNGDLFVVGYELYDNQSPQQELKSFVMKVDATNGTSTEGDLLAFQFLTISTTEIRSQCYGIEYQYNQLSKFVICGRIDQSSGASSIGFETYVALIDNNLAVSNIQIIPPFTTSSSIPGHTLFEMIPTDIHLRGNGDILVGAVDDYIFNNKPLDIYGGIGNGEVLIFDFASGYQYSTHVTLPHSIRAYDLKVGVIATENNALP